MVRFIEENGGTGVNNSGKNKQTNQKKNQKKYKNKGEKRSNCIMEVKNKRG